MKSGHELTVFYLIQTRVTKQQEKRRRQRQRRREKKQRKGSEPAMDDELTMKMQVWSVHEPEQINPLGKVADSTIESIDKDCINC